MFCALRLVGLSCGRWVPTAAADRDAVVLRDGEPEPTRLADGWMTATARRRPIGSSWSPALGTAPADPGPRIGNPPKGDQPPLADAW